MRSEQLAPRPTPPAPPARHALPTVEIRTGFFAGLRRRPTWTMIVRTADGRLLARRRFHGFPEAVVAAKAVCDAAQAGPERLDLAA